MRAYRAHVGLLVIGLAVLGAVLHPLAFLLGIAPFDPKGLVSFLNATKSLIADLLGWGVVALLAAMAIFITRGRLRKPPPSSNDRWLHTTGGAPDTGALSIAVAITAYNDAEATADAVRQFKTQSGVIEVIVIDNNSGDNTAELALAAGARVIRERRQGYGYACIRGLWEAARVPGADVVVLTEGDGTFVGDDIAKFQAYIRQADMVVGTRAVPGLVENGSQMDYFFTWGNIAVAFLLRLRFWNGQFLGAVGLTDVGCTFRAIRRDALERILPDLEVGGSHFLPHMMLASLARGLTIIEIPVTFRRRVGQSKGASRSLRTGLSVGLSMVWHILTYRPGVTANQRPAVFVDRDGVIVRNRKDYVKNWSEAELVPGAVDSLAKLSRGGHRVLVVTNQSAIGRGIASPKAVQGIHHQLRKAVRRAGGRIDSFLVCPHTPDDGCSCRKPRPGLLLKAEQQFKIDLASAYMIGDQPSDIEAAQAVGCRPLLVLGPARGTNLDLPSGDFDVTATLATAADFIVKNTCERAYWKTVGGFAETAREPTEEVRAAATSR